MEAVKKLNEHFLSCSICTDRFADPCTLGCGHTFCRGCLAEFTKTQNDAIQAKSMQCPICRQMTKVPNPSKTVDDWPKQLKPHFLIQGLLDAIGDSDDTPAAAAAARPGRQCFPCKQMGKSVHAHSFCEDCEVTLCDVCKKMHAILPATRHHTIVDLQGENKVKAKRRIICQEHRNVIEFYCKDCIKAICQKCCILHHRKCDSVVTIESMMTEMKSTVEDKKTSTVDAVRALRRNLVAKRNKVEEIGKDKSAMQSTIRRLSQQAVDIIKQKEKQLMDELDEFTEKQIGQLRGQIKSAEIDLQMYQHYSEFIDQALGSESRVDLYEVFQMCRSGLVDCDVADEEMTVRSSTDSIELIGELDEEMFRTRFQLCRLNIIHSDIYLTGKAVLHDTINTSTELDEEAPYPVDVAVLSIDGSETMVVTDQRNSCLKSFYLRGSQKQSSTLKLNIKPHTVSKWKQNLVVVCVFGKCFLLIQVTPDLLLHSTITTEKEYTCITAITTSTFAGGCRNPLSIDVIDMSGSITRSFTTFKTGRNLIKVPWYMCSTVDGHILVSDYGSSSVYCLTPEGDTVFTHTFLINDMRGITMTNSGDVFVLQHVDRTVVHLTKNGQFKQNLLTSQNGLVKPFGICLHGDCLYLTDVGDGSVKLFRFQ